VLIVAHTSFPPTGLPESIKGRAQSAGQLGVRTQRTDRFGERPAGRLLAPDCRDTLAAADDSGIGGPIGVVASMKWIITLSIGALAFGFGVEAYPRPKPTSVEHGGCCSHHGSECGCKNCDNLRFEKFVKRFERNGRKEYRMWT
jgi:hypothetical protein